MDPKKFQIRIDSILGGHSVSTHFAADDQFRSSLGIDPSLPITDSETDIYAIKPSGLIRPSPFSGNLYASSFRNSPRWILSTPKIDDYFLYDAVGSFASNAGGFNFSWSSVSDGGSLSNSSGNGAAYYDNYIYLSKNTTVARYGPMNGTPAFDGDYWGTTLSKTQLTNTTYPFEPATLTNSIKFPNHVLHRHSDGRLYIADVVDNKGVLHYISTSKTTVEGDTDNGSTYNKLEFGYGLWPMAMETYDNFLVIALYESPQEINNSAKGVNAKIAFWDTTSQNFNDITWVEMKDSIISSIKNVNGVLYVFSGNQDSRGVRISRLVGKSFQESFYVEDATLPSHGAVDSSGDRLIFGSQTVTPEFSASVFSIGLQSRGLSRGLFNVLRIVNSSTTTTITASAVKFAGGNYGAGTIGVGWGNGASDSAYAGFGANSVQSISGGYVYSKSQWWSQLFRIGRPFKILKLIIPLGQPIVSTSQSFTPKIYTDNGYQSFTLQTVNNTNYPNKNTIILRPTGLTGENNFWLELLWPNGENDSTLNVVALPIIIEYEILPNE